LKSIRRPEPAYAELNSERAREKELIAELEKTEIKLREVERNYR